jgi:hypothetical protein
VLQIDILQRETQVVSGSDVGIRRVGEPEQSSPLSTGFCDWFYNGAF